VAGGKNYSTEEGGGEEGLLQPPTGWLTLARLTPLFSLSYFVHTKLGS